MHPARIAASLALLSVLLPCWPLEAGILTERTRIIYPASSDTQTLLIANTNPWPILVQTWVDTGEGNPNQTDAPFVVLPAIFRLEANASQSLRILHTGADLPQMRESLFWLNLNEIPPVDSHHPDTDEAAHLTLTLTTQLKLLYRPKGIDAPKHLAAQLSFQLEPQDGHWSVIAHNPTPWHAIFSSIAVDGKEGTLTTPETDMLLPPFSSRDYRLPPGQPVPQAEIHFSLIDDAGMREEYHPPD